MMICRLCALAIGYLFGSFETGYFYGKRKGVDIREHGSGNTGATNSLRTFGAKGGVLTFLIDFIKPILAIGLVNLLFTGRFEGDMTILSLYAGLGAILGHNFPFYLKFKGGKGISCSAGVCLVVCPMAVPLCLLTFFICLITTRYVSLGSILMATLLILQIIGFWQFGFLSVSGAEAVEFVILICIIGVMAILRHKANIVRLLQGTENKIGQKK